MSHREKIVIIVDSNVLLVIISSRSKYHWLYKLILNGTVILAISQGIITEYEEVITRHWNEQVAKNTIRSILELPEVKFTTIHFNLSLVFSDPDDNKFADCAFAANAHYIITHDSDFNILKEIDFPRIPVVDINTFRNIIDPNNLL